MDRYTVFRAESIYIDPTGLFVEYDSVKESADRIAELEDMVRERDRALARVRKTADALVATGVVAGLIGQQIINDIEGK